MSPASVNVITSCYIRGRTVLSFVFVPTQEIGHQVFIKTHFIYLFSIKFQYNKNFKGLIGKLMYS